MRIAYSLGPIVPFAAVTAAMLLASASAHAATLTVGAGQMYPTPSAAAAVAADGDVIEIAAGTYRDVATFRANNLTLRGVGATRAHLDAMGLTISNRKAIWVIQGTNTTVENIEFSGAAVPDNNGAGIRQEGAGLTVRNCYFHDNENGILAGDSPTSDIVIESSEFARNGAGDGQSHNLYINRVRSLTFRANYSHDARVGHLLKSRAQATFVLYNRLTLEGGNGSYEVNLPNGGEAYLIGNVIQQSNSSQNRAMITFAEEGATNTVQRVFIVNNTLVNDRTAGATFVRLAGTPEARIVNNLVVGPGTFVEGTAETMGNVMTDAPEFVDRAGFDFHLRMGSPAVDRGIAAGMAGTMSLVPASHYVHPRALEARGVVGSAIDVGAYEFGTPASNPDAGVMSDSGTSGEDAAAPDDSGIPATDSAADATGSTRDGGTADGGTTSMRGGCGCSTAGRRDAAAHSALLLLVGAGALASRRRRRSR